MNEIGSVRDAVAKKRNPSAKASFPADPFLRLFVMLIPFQAAPLLFGSVSTGTQVLFVVAMLASTTLVLDARFLSPTDRLEHKALIWFLVYIVIFAISFIRSIPHLPRFAALFPLAFSSSVLAYFRWSFLLNVLFASSFVYVLKRMTSRRDLKHLFSAISISVFLLSIAVIFLILSDPSVITSRYRSGINGLTQSYLGQHYNDVANYYILTGPVLLYLALKRGSYWTVNYGLALAAVLLLQSRTGILTFFAASIATTIALGRAKTLVAAAPFIALGVLVAFGPVLTNLLSQGLDTQTGVSTDILLSGRLDKIWAPLLSEWWDDPARFYFGAGEYGLLSSNAFGGITLLRVGHPHNAFIEFFLDNGIVLFSALIVVIGVYLRWGWRVGRRFQSDAFWVLYLCTLAYLVGCFTGRHFWPDASNLTVFPILAALVNVARLESYGEQGARLRRVR